MRKQISKLIEIPERGFKIFSRIIAISPHSLRDALYETPSSCTASRFPGDLTRLIRGENSKDGP